MKFFSRAGNTALALTALLSIAACGNKGEVDKPATAQTTNAVPGTGAGHSETGGTGGSAATPASGNTGAVPGTTSSGEGRAASEGSAPTSSQ